MRFLQDDKCICKLNVCFPYSTHFLSIFRYGRGSDIDKKYICITRECKYKFQTMYIHVYALWKNNIET